MKKKIGIIGSGAVGQSLAQGFIKNGFEVMIGTGHTDKYDDLKKSTDGKAEVGSFNAAAEFGELLVMTVKGFAVEDVMKEAGFDNLKNKTIIDTTNPIADAPPVKGVLPYFTAPGESLMEKMQNLVPEAKFVKAFSCIGSAFMVDPDFGGEKPTMFICGNDSGAKDEVISILKQFGWEYEDMGEIEAARAIEPLAMLWCIPGIRDNSWSHAFKLLKK